MTKKNSKKKISKKDIKKASGGLAEGLVGPFDPFAPLGGRR